jgi:N-acetylglucosamine kinase-like BadF-type ATPase
VLFAGIDAGQSSTLAAIGDERGTVLGTGKSGPADEIGADASSTRMREALEGALAAAIADAKLGPDTRIDSIVAGISGYEGRVYGVPPKLPSNRVLLVHDGVIAHAGALNGEPGVVVIAGTGSVAVAVDEDHRARTLGGWGYLLGDEGSAFWIARTAMQAAIRHAPCPGEKQLLEYFERTSLRDVARSVYVGEITRAKFAGFAQTAIEAAQHRSGCACIYDPPFQAARELAKLAERAAHFAPRRPNISFVGGLVSDTWFRARVESETRDLISDAQVVAPQHEPVIGALLLASKA